VRVDARTLEVLDEHEALVAPERLDEAQLDALAINGFTKAAWEHALPLREALLEVAPLLEGALVAGHNVGFDWAFLEAGFRRAGLALPNVDYHRLDTASLAWPLVVTGELPSMSLDPLATCSGSSARRPHRALADARCSLEVARRLVERMRAGGAVTGLPVDERQICDALLGRLAQGRRQYGPWRLDDGRDYPSEAYAEVLDGLHYTAAELVRRRRIEAGRRRRVYVCHPFANDPAGNIERVRAISQFLIDDGALPIAPHLYLPQLIDEATEREQALRSASSCSPPATRFASSASSSPRAWSASSRGEAARAPGSLRSGGASMSGAHSRRKGAGFERELVQRFREVMPDATIRRGLQFRTGEETPDVDCPVFWPRPSAASSRTSGARCARPRTLPRPGASPSRSFATTAPSRSSP
jgi:DNA polymerase III epsilon subunit-like protein